MRHIENRPAASLRLALTGSGTSVSFGSTREYRGGIGLSRAGKTRHRGDLHPVDQTTKDTKVHEGSKPQYHLVPHDDPLGLSRRNFLIRCCQGASAALLPARLRDLAFPSAYAFQTSANPEFHLHPHYRAQTPLDATLLKTQAGLDDFVTEKYADQIAAILAEWSAGLLESPQEMQAVEKVLTSDFSGSSFRPVESRLVRSGALEICQNKFTRQAALRRDAFLQELRSAFSPFSK
ncbi:MAG TPA: hypothetical protein VJK29_13380, partial [Terriglobales bacterium]|nr:hypothetical protein [Terriglobales bacterium]